MGRKIPRYFVARDNDGTDDLHLFDDAPELNREGEEQGEGTTWSGNCVKLPNHILKEEVKPGERVEANRISIVMDWKTVKVSSRGLTEEVEHK